MAGCVNGLDLEIIAYLDGVSGGDSHQVVAAELRPIDFDVQHVHRNIRIASQEGKEHIHVIVMVVSDEAEGGSQPPLFDLLHDRLDIPGRIHDGTVVGRVVFQQVHEIVPGSEGVLMDGEIFFAHSG